VCVCVCAQGLQETTALSELWISVAGGPIEHRDFLYHQLWTDSTMSRVLRIFHSDVLFTHKKACERSTLKVNICSDRSEFCLGHHAWILIMFNCVFDITNPLGFIIPKS
jgi:hypothetical protein